ncbi:hypothetical protein NQ315_011287 [Exocentrus adspersus]|uniref:MULE transposase domain-containing protein n=1 Tax=Exocentrus adspersus TaxID=1586481 RepID=A0AAV8VK42_9CUCU|nr:hypothetical protein NQ315_011287 [Exocentrus adspersus]
MKNSQQLMLEKFGCNTIAVDSTHGLNQYDFELTTVLVIDEYGEGFPAACMFSNRKDTYGYEDEEGFPLVLLNAINTFCEDEETREFGNYFSRNYSSNSKLWARCYRKDCSVNTNMHLESMHRTLKHCYLDGKVVKRLDKGLYAVLKLIRDKTVERLIKKTKGKNNRPVPQKQHCVEFSLIIPLELQLLPEIFSRTLIFRKFSRVEDEGEFSEKYSCSRKNFLFLIEARVVFVRALKDMFNDI